MACGSTVKRLHRGQNQETAAKSPRRRGPIDKLGVTGSSPVLPIKIPAKRPHALPGLLTDLLVEFWSSRQGRRVPTVTAGAGSRRSPERDSCAVLFQTH